MPKRRVSHHTSKNIIGSFVIIGYRCLFFIRFHVEIKFIDIAYYIRIKSNLCIEIELLEIFHLKKHTKETYKCILALNWFHFSIIYVINNK